MSKEQEIKDFLESRFAKIGLSMEQVRRMSLSEHREYAQKLHDGKEMKVVGTSTYSPVSGNYYLMNERFGSLNAPE